LVVRVGQAFLVQYQVQPLHMVVAVVLVVMLLLVQAVLVEAGQRVRLVH
jgi:hypothetical protein